MTLTYKIGIALITTLFALALFAGTTFADTSCVIRNNGARSRNRCRIRITRTRRVTQRNWSWIGNSVVIIANTGGNDANDNTGGDVDVDSGDAIVVVSITNTVNQTNITP